MRLRLTLCTALAWLAAAPWTSAAAVDGNRLAYLDESSPYYVHRDFPKLTTPMWVGEPGVEAVVVLAIDDMTDNAPKYEAYLRPILDWLKAIDGRAPVSIMTNRVDPAEPLVARWLAEGVNLDVHTLTHPCPLLRKGDFAEASRTYHECVDLLAKVPGNAPAAFRMPCCDSLNTPSPRFFAEIFNTSSPGGRHLAIDSSVFCILTPDDPALPRSLVLDPDGRERFRKYLPFKSFVNTIENYPYPYVIGRTCWEFPCIVPSDWEAQNLHKPNNPKTVEDLKAALDAVVLKQGVFNLVFHPHGWIKSEQVVELIDYAVKTHGTKVKFLNFREAKERLNLHMLQGHALRDVDGRDNGIRLLDLNDDGYLDVLIGNEQARLTRMWNPGRGSWTEFKFPGRFVREGTGGVNQDAGLRFGMLPPYDPKLASTPSVLDPSFQKETIVWSFGRFTPGGDDDPLLRERDRGIFEDGFGYYWFENNIYDWTSGFPIGPRIHGGSSSRLPGVQVSELKSVVDGKDRGIRLRDLDGDGDSEILVANDRAQHVLQVRRRRMYRRDRHQVELVRMVLLPLPGLEMTAGFMAALRAPRPGMERCWEELRTWKLPPGARFVGPDGLDGGLRFVDVNEDGREDLVFSNDEGYGVYLFESLGTGWSKKVLAGKAGEVGSLPKIARGGTDNGFWVHSRHLWWQNEDTAGLPDLVDRRSFDELLKGVESRAKSAEASRRSIRVRPGFRVELAAAEPLVTDPIAFDWSADGRLWVVEMGDYPLGADGKGRHDGRVRVLEDADGDGRYDRSTVFLDGLAFPTGVMPWRKGVLVACAPDILYAEDSDGNGKADVRRTLFTGFKEGNQQHRLNGFALGLDGWVYGANGDSGGTIRSVETGREVPIGGRDFRFEPDAGAFEAESGMTQFGRARDDWGRWFGTNNPSWGWHYVLSDRDLRRNPFAALASPRQVLDPDTRLFPVSRTAERFNDPGAANRTTSGCSPAPYRDDLFGPHFATSLFVSEPVHNLVHRVVLEPDGPTLRGRRAPDEADREFLASSDPWFRPTTIKTGPDGALWIADMYRAVIEHPEWIPDDWEQRLDLRAGHDRGRIYRVVPVDRPARPIPRLDRLDAAGLAAAMDGPNGWVRDTAMRLLLHDHRGSEAAVAVLRRLAAGAGDPKVRLQALCTLDRLGGLDGSSLTSALADAHPQVRRQAARLAPGRAGDDETIAAGLRRLADDPDAEVRLQVAVALGDWPDLRAGAALARLALRDRDEPWARAAVLSSATPHAGAILAGLFEGAGAEGPPSTLVEPLFATLGAANDRGGLTGLVRTVAGQGGEVAPWQFSAFAGLADAAARARVPLEKWNAEDPAWGPAVDGLAKLRAAARAALADADATEEARVRAAGALGRVEAERDADLDALVGVLRPQVPPAVQLAAIAALGRMRDRRVPEKLLAGWRGHGPAVRAAVLDVLVGRDAWAAGLLSSLEDTCVPAAEVGSAFRARLLDHPDNALRARAEAVFGSGSASRQQVLDAYADAAARPGDRAAGAAVFRRACATCHRFDGVGHEVGPDLAALTDKSPMSLLVAILDPNRNFEAPHAEFVVNAADGRVLTGRVAAETATGVTLLGPEGRAETLLRSDIEEMAATGRSLMPEGLEKDVTVGEMADLIAYLRATGPPPDGSGRPSPRCCGPGDR